MVGAGSAQAPCSPSSHPHLDQAADSFAYARPRLPACTWNVVGTSARVVRQGRVSQCGFGGAGAHGSCGIGKRVCPCSLASPSLLMQTLPSQDDSPSSLSVESVSVPSRVMIAIVQGYRLFLRPVFGNRCRYFPSCSEYALQAVREHGAARGAWIGGLRILRCHPFCAGGYDPVPPKGSTGLFPRTPQSS